MSAVSRALHLLLLALLCLGCLASPAALPNDPSDGVETKSISQHSKRAGKFQGFLMKKRKDQKWTEQKPVWRQAFQINNITLKLTERNDRIKGMAYQVNVEIKDWRQEKGTTGVKFAGWRVPADKKYADDEMIFATDPTKLWKILILRNGRTIIMRLAKEGDKTAAPVSVALYSLPGPLHEHWRKKGDDHFIVPPTLPAKIFQWYWYQPGKKRPARDDIEQQVGNDQNVEYIEKWAALDNAQ